ncbi:MAG: thioesterase family protein [Alphaproteobacteria bacterium]
MQTHRYDVTIRFSHCDPAGMVYFPRFFSLFNDAVEDWFTRGLGIDYADLLTVRREGLPLAHTEADFARPVFMGECLSIHLSVDRIGRTSLALAFDGRVGDEHRLLARTVHVHTSLRTHRPEPIADDWRARMAPYLREAAA